MSLYQEELDDLKRFVERLLFMILRLKDYELHIFSANNLHSLINEYNLSLSTQYLVLIKAENISCQATKLAHVLNRKVITIDSNMLYWNEGDSINQEEQLIVESPIEKENGEMRKVRFRKSTTILPHWLDKKIFNDHNAIYAPEYNRYEYNLDLNDDELRVYLGTYFPRSYAEMFCIVDSLMQNNIFAEIVQAEDQINVLDCGCGTGGEILGIITALAKHLPQVHVNVTAIDGNEGALAILKELIESIPNRNVHAQLSTLYQTFNMKEDLAILANGKKNYHFVLCDKMVCELISKHILPNDAYAIMAKMLASHLQENGLLIMLDVTTKDEHSGLFYPQLMNYSINEYVRKSRMIETLLPLSCASNEGCKDLCFMQQTFIVSHSHKTADESRVCYRVLCKKTLKEVVLQNVKTEGIAHVIHPIKYNQNDKSAFCNLTKDNKTIIDSFNINLK